MSMVKEYKCLNCKAALLFDPPTQRWKCHYCFSDFTKDSLDSFPEAEMEYPETPELDVYHCNSCGAELMTDNTISATSCLYCKSTAIIKTRFSGKFKPKYLIPFRLTKAQAKEIYNQWIKKRFFAPSAFKAQEEIEKITGIYAPFWLFDSKVNGRIEGEGVKTRHWSQGEYRYTQTKFYRVVRGGQIAYKRIPVDASKKLDDILMHKIEPYNYADLTDFSMQYMSGFMAERYDVEADKAEQVMKGRVEKYTEDRLRGTVSGYSSYKTMGKQIDLFDTAESYSLLPVYLLINKYKDKEHIFIINGQTGKVVGDAPIDIFKQLRFAGAVFAAVWFIAVFGGALLG